MLNFAAWEAYKHIENGLEGEAPDTIKYKNLFFEAMRTLELTLPVYTRGLLLK